MKVTLLGTGSPIPDASRAGPSTLVQAGPLNLLFDCGRGVLMRLAAAGLFPGMLQYVVLTHLHSDHTTDFNDLVTTDAVRNWDSAVRARELEAVGFLQLTLAANEKVSWTGGFGVIG